MDTTSGDGIDSNGTLSISGGTVVVWTNSTADNQPLDADGTLSITGGTVLAAGGSAGMGITLSGDSQPYVMFASTGMGGRPGSIGGQHGGSISISKGSTFTIRSSDGTAVYTGEAVYDARFVFFSSAAMTSGETYTLTSGGTELATATADGTGTAAVTTPDTSADTADTPQTSGSHAGLYIALGTVAVLGAAAAMVTVVLRKQKKA